MDVRKEVDMCDIDIDFDETPRVGRSFSTDPLKLGRPCEEVSARSLRTKRRLPRHCCLASGALAAAVVVVAIVWAVRSASGVQESLEFRVQPDASLDLKEANDTYLAGSFSKIHGRMDFVVDCIGGLLNLTYMPKHGDNPKPVGLLHVARGPLQALLAWRVEESDSWFIMGNDTLSLNATIAEVLDSPAETVIAKARPIDACKDEICDKTPEGLDRFVHDRAGATVLQLSIKLAAAGYDGGRFEAARRLHLVARQLRFFRADDGFSQEEVKIVNDFVLQRSTARDNSLGRRLDPEGREKTWGECNVAPYKVVCGNNKCFSMCGYGCRCWSWVCGDCCCHEGCQYHDYYCTCRSMFHRRCWGLHDVWQRGCASCTGQHWARL